MVVSTDYSATLSFFSLFKHLAEYKAQFQLRFQPKDICQNYAAAKIVC